MFEQKPQYLAYKEMMSTSEVELLSEVKFCVALNKFVSLAKSTHDGDFYLLWRKLLEFNKLASSKFDTWMKDKNILAYLCKISRKLVVFVHYTNFSPML